MQRKICIISGIGPGPSGTGRFVGFLLENIPVELRDSVDFVLGPPTVFAVKNAVRSKKIKSIWIVSKLLLGAYWRLLIKVPFVVLNSNTELLFFHPQNFGYYWALKILQWKRGKKRLFLLDSSFFCIRSYNNIPGENEPCTRCIGGSFDSIDRNCCLPFPIPSRHARKFTEKLIGLVKSGSLGLLAQNVQQMDLALRHFGEEAKVQLAGVWTDEYDECLKSERQSSGVLRSRPKVVFHANYHPAKGALWLAELARLMPDVDFLFPFPKPAPLKDSAANIEFKPMTWDSGLASVITEADAVFVPSLWSAPIEGALIKSIVTSRRAVAVKNQSAFLGDIPDDVVFKLDREPNRAADQLREILSLSLTPSPASIEAWKLVFKENRARVLQAVFG